MSSGNGIIAFGDAIIYLQMSDFRDEDFTIWRHAPRTDASAFLRPA